MLEHVEYLVERKISAKKVSLSVESAIELNSIESQMVKMYSLVDSPSPHLTSKNWVVLGEESI